MTRKQLYETLDSIGWSRAVLARKLGLNSDRVIRLWAVGSAPIPPQVAGWLWQVAETLEALPPPKDWA